MTRRPIEGRRYLNSEESDAMGFVDWMAANEDDGWPYPDRERGEASTEAYWASDGSHCFLQLIRSAILVLACLLTTPALGQWAYRFVPQGPPQIYRRYYATPIRDFLFGRYRIYQPGYWQPGYWRWTPCEPGYYPRGPIQGKHYGEGWNRWHTRTTRP